MKLVYPVRVTPAVQPDVRPLTATQYISTKNYIVVFRTPDRFIRVIVPKGFVSDGASVPRLAWTISGLRPDGLIRAAALVHDYLYKKNGACQDGFVGHSTQFKVTRAQADMMFKMLMEAAGMSKYRVFLAYSSVRMFARRW